MLQQIEYSGTVWALSHNDPEPLIEHSIKKLGDYGVKKEDIKIVDAPDNPEVGQVVVEIWPHELVVARIRTVRGESFISGTELNIELKSDELSFPKLNKWQIVWINRYVKHGGTVLIFKETPSKATIKLYRPVSSFTDPRSLKPVASFSSRGQWPRIQEQLEKELVLRQLGS